jgi:Flp pilus assembly protein TadB
MITLAGALVGMLAAVGVLVAVRGWMGLPDRLSATRPDLATGELWWRSTLVVGAAFIAWLVTGLPAVAVLCAAAAGVGPMLIGLRRRRDVAIARSDALAAWAEMLRDTIASHAGLSEAIAITARVAPAPIRPEVQALAVRAERDSLTDALRRFAADVADPVADLIVASLVIAADRQAQRLAELLAGIASAAREQSAMRMRVETGRARTYASSKALVVITLGLAVALMLFSPTFMEPYDSATGQAVLLVIGGLFVGALWGLVELGRPVAPPRLLGGVDGSDVGQAIERSHQ